MQRLTLTLAALLAVAVLSGCNAGPTFDPGASSAALARAAELSERAQSAEKRGEKDLAINLYRQAVAAYDDYYPAWNNLGVLLVEKDLYAQAAEAFKRASSLAPGDPCPPANLALIYLKRGYDKQAAEYFDQAIARNDAYLPALRESVRLDVQTDRITEETQKRCDKALILETEERWIPQLQRFKIRIDQRLAAAKESV